MRLEDHLFHLRERKGGEAFKRAAKEYLDEWSSSGRAWLRKYYPPEGDEPHFDLTSATEKAIEWVSGLGERRFVGTESRLLTVFELLRQLAEGTEEDPAARIAELEKRRDRIEDEFREIREGRLSLMEPTKVRDRFLQMAGTARGLLGDFREVERNFRDLDRSVRDRIAAWDGSKGSLLQDVFGESDAIRDSDQGRSFQAFWDFLMSPSRQEEFTSLLETVLSLPAVSELRPDRRLFKVHFDWLQAGEQAQRTVARLSAQLRRYLDDQAALENRPDESARFGLDLFKSLGLQLLIVTPLQKIHIIEPYVAGVGFVHNQEGGISLLRNQTIEEYRAEKAAWTR